MSRKKRIKTIDVQKNVASNAPAVSSSIATTLNTPEKQSGAFAWLLRINSILPILLAVPVLFYVLGYFTAKGYYLYYGGLWLMPEVPHAKLLEMAIYPATSMLIYAGVIWYLSYCERMWKLYFRIFHFLVYISLIYGIYQYGDIDFRSFFNLSNYELNREQWHIYAEVTLAIWSAILFTLCILHINGKNGSINRFTHIISIVVSLFGLIHIPEDYGYAIAYQESQYRIVFDQVVWKNKTNGKVEHSYILLIRGDKYYIVNFRKNPLKLSEIIGESEADIRAQKFIDKDSKIDPDIKNLTKALYKELNHTMGDNPLFMPYQTIGIVKEEDVMFIVPFGGLAPKNLKESEEAQKERGLDPSVKEEMLKYFKTKFDAMDKASNKTEDIENMDSNND